MGKRFDFEFNPFTLEQLRAMSEDEIATNINRFRRLIKVAINTGIRTITFETELCYLDHERQMRSNTAKAHRSYARPDRFKKFDRRR